MSDAMPRRKREASRAVLLKPALSFAQLVADALTTAQVGLFSALSETLWIKGTCLARGLVFFVVLAVTGRLFANFTRTFLPVAMVAETIPLVAPTLPLVLGPGCGSALTLWVPISVSFISPCVMPAKGLAQGPRHDLIARPWCVGQARVAACVDPGLHPLAIRGDRG